MDDLRTRVTAAVHEVLNKYFEAPERNWPGATHDAIAGVKSELIQRVKAEFDRKDEVAAAPEKSSAEAEE